MNTELIPLVSFVLVTTFTPGPNNISSGSMGVLFGYGSTFPYIAGIASGFFFIMLLCAYVSSTLLQYLPTMEPALRILGALYILWLAWNTLRATYGFNNAHQKPLGFKQGFILQAINCKVVIYGLTLYSTFLSSISHNLPRLALFALIFAFTSFCSTSTWAVGGTLIRKELHDPKMRIRVNAVLVALLVYCAVDISGFLALM